MSCEGGEVSIPLDGMDEPRFRREGGMRDQVLPGNKKFVEGDILPRPNPRAAEGRDAGEGDGEDAFRFVLTREEFVDLFLDDLELPDLAKRKLAEVEAMACAGPATRLRLAREHLGQPDGAAALCATGGAAAAAARKRIAALEAELDVQRGATRRARGGDRGAEGEDASAFPLSIRSISAIAASRTSRSRWRRR